MTLNWHIRAYEPGDEAGLVTLFAQTYGWSITEAHWQWKVKGQSSPFENVWLAAADDRLLGQYAVVPVRMQLEGELVWGVVGVDAMVAPEARRQGIWTNLVTYGHTVWAEAGVVFAMGLPNERWGSRIEALGWQALFPLQWVVRPLRLEALLAERTGLAFLRRLIPIGTLWHQWQQRRLLHDTTIHIDVVTQADERFDRVWAAIRQDYAVSVVRDAAWVKWRYFDCPTYAYQVLLAQRGDEPVGYAVYRLAVGNGRRVGFLAELVAAAQDEAARQMLMGAVVHRLREAGAETAVTVALPETPLYRTFRQAGFMKGKAAFTVRLVPLRPALSLTPLRQTQKWHLVGGDFDIV